MLQVAKKRPQTTLRHSYIILYQLIDHNNKRVNLKDREIKEYCIRIENNEVLLLFVNRPQSPTLLEDELFRMSLGGEQLQQADLLMCECNACKHLTPVFPES